MKATSESFQQLREVEGRILPLQRDLCRKNHNRKDSRMGKGAGGKSPTCRFASYCREQLWCPVDADVCHSAVLAVRINAARLTKGNAEDSGAAPVAMGPGIHKQIKIPCV